MTCQDFQSRLDEAIATRDRAELARLASHGESCTAESCQAAWRDYALTYRAVGAWREAECVYPPRLADRVLANVAIESKPTPAVVTAASVGRTSRSQWLSVCIAAALLVAVGFIAHPAPDAKHVAVLPHRSVEIAAEPPTLVADGEVQSRRESYVELAHEATYFMTDLAMLVVPVEVDDPSEAESPNWFRRLGTELEPVRTGVEGKLSEWFSPPAT